MKHRKRTKALSWLLSLALVLGLMPGMRLTALAYDNNPYAGLVNTTTKVKFNGYDWYIIADNSTSATAGTVTLLAADTSFGVSEFDKWDNNNYSNSALKYILDGLTASGGSFADVTDAIVTNTDAGGKLYLLSTSEAQSLSSNVLKMNFTGGNCAEGEWWLRSPGIDPDNPYSAAVVLGEYSRVDEYGYGVDMEFGVRPALMLDLSYVIFSSINLSSGANAEVSGGGTSQTYFDYGSTRSAMTDVTYTASSGYKFPETGDYYTTTNGITVSRTSDTVVTVSGTPEGIANITVPDAVHSHSFTYTAGVGDNANTITATCTDGCPDEYDTTGITLTLTAPESLTYDGNAKAAAISGYPDTAPANLAAKPTTITYYKSTGAGSTTPDGSALSGAPANAGNYVAQMTWGEKTASVAFTISSMPLTITGATATNRAYDKDSTAVAINAVMFKDGNDQSVSLTQGENSDYTVTGEMTDASAGDGKNVAVTVTLKNANYSLATNTTTTTVNISKAAAQILADVTDSQLYTLTSVSESVAGNMPDDAGTLTYTAGAASKTGSVTVSNFAVDSSGNVTATLSGGAAGDTVTLPVTIGSTNYADSTVNIKITLMPKSDAGVTISGVPTQAKIYGDADFTLTGSVTSAGTGSGTWTWSTSDDSVFQITPDGSTATVKILKAGSATVTAKYESDTTVDTETTAAITVNTKTLTIQAKDQSIYVGGTVPSLSGTDFYTVSGLVGTDTLTTSPTLAYQKNGSAVTPDNTTAGTYDIVPSGTNAGDNYSISYTNGTLTISNKGTQTISAENVTVTYGDTNKRVSASVTTPSTGGGAISYAVRSDSEDYIEVNASTGALTIKKVGTATVIVTAAETGTYAKATKEVTVIVSKASQLAPGAPAEKSKTSTSVTLEKTNGYQYSKDGTNWQDSNVFENLTASTEYTFCQRVAGDDNHNPSPASSGTKIKTTQYTLVYNSGGGTGEMAPIGVSDNDTYKFPVCTFGAPQHKKFDHWKMSGVDGIFYPDDQDHNTVQISRNCADTDGIIIVTAHWKFTNSATVKTAPTAKNPIYNGNAQELVTGGVAENGTMNYAIGTDETTAPTTGWSESIPVATNVETFYVWYKAAGDSSHGDSDAYCVTAEIKKRSVILTSENGEKTYDGSALTKPAVTVSGDGFVTGEVSDVKATGSVTKVAEGEVTNTITYTTGTTFKADNYTIQKNEGKLKITQKAVTATVTAVNRDYAAGNKSVSLIAGKVNDAVAGDDVTVDVSAASGTMANDSAGTDKTVTVTGVKLGGTAAGSYTFSAQPTGVTVTINRITDPAVITETARVIVGGNTVDLSGNVTNAVGDVSYEFDGEANGCTLDGSRLTSGNTTGTCKVKVTIGDSTNYTGKTGTITVTVTDKTSAQLAVTQANTVYGTALADPVWTRPANPVKDAVISYSGTTTAGSAYGPDSKKPTEAGSYTVFVTEETIDTIYSGSANFTISKAANPATVAGTASIMRDGKTVDLANNVTRNGATGAVSYAISGEANGCTLDGSVLTSGANTGSVIVNVTVAEDDNYLALAATPIIVTISDKNTQKITAGDVTATYGDTDKYVIASTDGDGAISYAVKAGSEASIDVDAATGALTIKAVPVDRKAYVTVTAAETASFNAATKDVTVTISPEGSSGEPSENPLTYNGNAQKLVTPGTADGGEFYYTLGEDGTTAPAFYLNEAKTQIDTARWSTSVPEGTNAGTYYVWYIVKGDANHNDSAEACVTVEMAKKELKITAEAKSKTVGEADPALTWTAEGLVGSDAVTGALSREAGEATGTYQITQGTLSAGNNYAITFTPAVLTINKAPDPVPEPSGGGGGGTYYGGGAVQNRPREPYGDVVGATATSCGDSSPERIHNIELVCEKLNGVILQPGETFSFNETVGPLTAAAGFEPAPVDPDDETTEEIGGGVSQVASTLYAGSLFSLLETVERTNHAFPVSFIQPGTDAAVTNAEHGGLDLKFRNSRNEPIRITAACEVNGATNTREIRIEIMSALGASDYMPILFDSSWDGNSSGGIPAAPIDPTRPGYRIVLDHEEQSFADAGGSGIRTLTHRKILDANGWLVSDEILNPRLPDGSYAMDTYYFHG